MQTSFVSSGTSVPELAERFAADLMADPEFSLTLYDADPRDPAPAAAGEQTRAGFEQPPPD